MKFFQVSVSARSITPTRRKSHKGDIKLNALLQIYYYTLFDLSSLYEGNYSLAVIRDIFDKWHHIVEMAAVRSY